MEHKPDVKPKPIIGEVTYKKAIEFVLKTMKAKRIGEKMPLTQFCREHNINYQVLLNIKNNEKIQSPSTIAKVLESLGYKIIVKKEIQYKYIISPIANKRIAGIKNPKKR